MGARARIVLGDPADTLEDSAMEFRLTYEGRLASGASASAKHKQDIRRALHPQLRRLWQTHPFLTEAYKRPWSPGIYDANPGGYLTRIDQLANFFRRGEYQFVPLVVEEIKVLCHLDILFLRPGKPGETLNAGDIDNRIKTLVDALKVPSGLPEKPGQDEIPFFVLLEDDRLVTRLSVETDTLLEPTGPEAGQQDARLIITVRLQPYLRVLGTLGM